MVRLPTVKTRGAVAGAWLIMCCLPSVGRADDDLGFEPRFANGIELEGVLGLGARAGGPMLVTRLRGTYRSPHYVSLELASNPQHLNIVDGEGYTTTMLTALALFDSDFLAVGGGLGLMNWSAGPHTSHTSSFLLGHFRLGSSNGFHARVRFGTTLDSPNVLDDGHVVGGFASAFLFGGALQIPLARVFALRLEGFGTLLIPGVLSFDVEGRVRIGDRAPTDFQLIFGYRLTATRTLDGVPGHAVLIGVEYQISTAGAPPPPCSEWVTACP